MLEALQTVDGEGLERRGSLVPVPATSTAKGLVGAHSQHLCHVPLQGREEAAPATVLAGLVRLSARVNRGAMALEDRTAMEKWVELLVSSVATSAKTYAGSGEEQVQQCAYSTVALSAATWTVAADAHGALDIRPPAQQAP
jgi:hypothetical protein